MNRGRSPFAHRPRGAVCLLGALLVPAMMTAQIDRSHPPAAGPAPEVHLGEHSTFVLPNGMRVIVVENHKLPLANVQVRFDIPPVAQDEKVGYIDMVGDLLAAGTDTRSKAAIDEEVDRLGAGLHTTSDGVYASGLKKNLPALLDVVADVVTAPSFPEDEFRKTLVRYRSATQQRRDDPDAIAETVGRAATFGLYHPYGEVMTDATLDQVTVDAVRAYYHRFFRPEKGYVVFVGDITSQEARELAMRHFGNWKATSPVGSIANGEEEVPELGLVRYLTEPVLASGDRRVVLVDRPGSPQSMIRVSFPLNLKPNDIRALKAQVMNTILGGGVFNARLMQNLREDKGWTYGAYSSLDSDRFNGSFTASVSVRTDVTDSAITEILKEVEHMRSVPIDQADLDLAKKYMAGSFARSLEDPRTVARFALNTYLNGLPPDHYATYLKRLDAVTVADVQEAANAFLYPDNAVIFVVGDKASIVRKLAPLSMDFFTPVLELDVDGAPWEEKVEPVEGLTADEVIERYLTAIGGRKNIAKLTSLQRIMEGRVGVAPTKLTETFGPGGKYNMDLVVDHLVVQQVVSDGERASDRQENRLRELSGTELSDQLMSAVPVPEMDLARTTTDRVLVGSTTFEGAKVYKVDMTTTGGTVMSDYYDATTGLKVRRVEPKMMYGQLYTVSTVYRDHRAVEGVLLPHALEQEGGAMGLITLKATSITVPKSVPAGTFDTGLDPVGR